VEWERKVGDERIEWHEPNDGAHWHGQIWTAEETILSDGALRSLGLVAYWAAWLEHHVENALIELLSGLDNRRGKIMTREMTASDMIRKARSLINLAPAPDASWLAALDKATLALQQRNRVLHGAMGGHFVDGMASLSNRRKGELSEVSDAEIARVAEQIFDAAMTVVDVRWHTLDMRVSP
jgi:hypothetical protein